MQRKSFIIAATLMVGLALGVVLSPSLRGSSASAQTQPPTATPSTSPVATLRELFMDKLAAALGIQRSALDTAITTAGNDTADAAVQQGTLTQEQADALKLRIQSGEFSPFGGRSFGGFGGRGGPGGRGGAAVAGLKQAMVDAAAGALNITSDELQTQLRSGQTIAQLAAAHNTTEQAVVNAALAAAKTQLDQAVTGGALTQAQADTIYAELQQRGADLLNHAGRGGRGRRGGSTTPATPDATPTTAPEL